MNLNRLRSLRYSTLTTCKKPGLSAFKGNLSLPPSLPLLTVLANRWVNLKAAKRLVEAEALKMEIIPNPKVCQVSECFMISFAAFHSIYIGVHQLDSLLSAITNVGFFY